MHFTLLLALPGVSLGRGKLTFSAFVCPHRLTSLRFYRQTIGSQTACGVKILNHTLYLLYGPENIAAIWKYKTSITSPCIHSFCLSIIFGMAPKAVEMYSLDTSGIMTKPNFHSIVASHNRVDYHTHAGFYRQFNGKGLLTLYDRWSNNFASRLERLDIKEE